LVEPITSKPPIGVSGVTAAHHIPPAAASGADLICPWHYLMPTQCLNRDHLDFTALAIESAIGGDWLGQP